MESEGINLLINSTVLFAGFAGACVLLLMYIIKLLNAEQKNVDDVDVKPKNEKLSEHSDRKKESTSSGKSKKKGTEGRWTGRSDKQTFAHPWLLTSLKGHTAQVLDMEFSSNGKYLASCGEEEPDPGGDLQLDCDNISSGSSSSNSDSNRDNSLPSSATPSPRTKGLSRRQRKNRRRDDPSPPENKKSKPKRPEPPAVPNRKPINSTPLKHFVKLNLAERDLAGFLVSYVLSPQQMLAMGYPIETLQHPGQAMIFKSTMSVPTYQSSYRYTKVNVSESRFDVNAQEFVPGMDYSEIKAEWNANHDSGQGSGSSSDSGEVSEESSTSVDLEPRIIKKTMVNQLYTDDDRCSDDESRDARECARCTKEFFVGHDNTYITKETCTYHWGKLHNGSSAGKHNKPHASVTEYTCCRGKPGSPGCQTCKHHVWNGLTPGFNGPYDGYMRTRSRKSLPHDGNYGVYALDCEMSYTAAGLELTKVTVVGADGRLVYDSFVKPRLDIIDYNTRFSGVTMKDLTCKKGAVKTLREVQNDLMGFINADTILIGHGLENDLRALRIMHYNIVDTACTFPHYNGLPYRRSLKNLTFNFLNREIQCAGDMGHNSYEDARACIELMLWRVHKDFHSILAHYRR